MLRSLLRAATVAGALAAFVPSALAADFKIDDDHSSMIFGIHHFSAAWVYGFMNAKDGEFTIDDAGNLTAVSFSVDMASVFTDQEKRDKHIKGADFFDAEQFPKATFKSTKITAKGPKAWTVTGDLTLHGVTKAISFDVAHTGEGKDPWGGYRLGLETRFSIKRSDFGITHMSEGLGDEVKFIVAIEGVKKVL